MKSADKKLKIFVSAYACEPHKGSEPAIGWNVVNELAKYHEVHVLTRANNRESIEIALQDSEVKSIFHYYDLPKWISFWKRKRFGYRQYYYLWQYGAFLQYRKFINNNGFDIVQHLTFANFAVPSLFMFCKQTTVYGPIGLPIIPRAVFKALPTKIKLIETIRKVMMFAFCHLDIARVLTPIMADKIIECGIVNNQSSFQKQFQKKIISHPQTGINSSEIEYQTERKRTDVSKVRLLICSDLWHWKGVRFSAEVFSRIAQRRDDVELQIYGKGSEKTNMKNYFKTYQIEDKVKFMGHVSKAEMMQALFDADILLYPSYHHGLATVILQAMYAKLPIVAMHGDPIGEVVAQGAGLVAKGNTMPEILADLEAKTEQLINDQSLRQKLGNNGRTLVATQYEWAVLVKNLSEKLIKI